MINLHQLAIILMTFTFNSAVPKPPQQLQAKSIFGGENIVSIMWMEVCYINNMQHWLGDIHNYVATSIEKLAITTTYLSIFVSMKAFSYNPRLHCHNTIRSWSSVSLLLWWFSVQGTQFWLLVIKLVGFELILRVHFDPLTLWTLLTYTMHSLNCMYITHIKAHCYTIISQSCFDVNDCLHAGCTSTFWILRKYYFVLHCDGGG